MFKKFLMLIMIIAFPVFLVLTNLYFLTSSSFVEYEYKKNSFPESSYFNNEERISTARKIIAYLHKKEDISSLKALSVFKEEEISHLSDVRGLMNKAFIIQKISGVLIILSATSLLIDEKSKKKVPFCLFIASIITIVVFSLIIILIYINFDWFFITFHQLLFRHGSWAFFPTDTLIQLFPRKFWVDAAKTFTLLVLIESLLISIVTRRFSKNK